jgi:hypothetical protein
MRRFSRPRAYAAGGFQGALVSSAPASVAPHPDRRRSRRSAQPAALSRLGLAGPGADATPATDAAFPNTP